MNSKKTKTSPEPVITPDTPTRGQSINIITYRKNGSRRVTTSTPGGTLTKQSFGNETDINKIMAQYMQTGQLPAMNNLKPQFGDAPETDFQTAMNIVTSGQSLFNELPSDIRRDFNHDPAAFLDFCTDPENAEQLIEMGLMPQALAQPSKKAEKPPEKPSDTNKPADSGKDEAANDQLPS